MAAGLRIDKLLWFLRLARTRALAQDWAQAGHIRLNGRRVERAHQAFPPAISSSFRWVRRCA
jgi:ribosome-associated heat shock protein Hsp15